MKIKSMWNFKQNKHTKQACEYQHMKAAAIILKDVQIFWELCQNNAIDYVFIVELSFASYANIEHLV